MDSSQIGTKHQEQRYNDKVIKWKREKICIMGNRSFEFNLGTWSYFSYMTVGGSFAFVAPILFPHHLFTVSPFDLFLCKLLWIMLEGSKFVKLSNSKPHNNQLEFWIMMLIQFYSYYSLCIFNLVPNWKSFSMLLHDSSHCSMISLEHLSMEHVLL